MSQLHVLSDAQLHRTRLLFPHLTAFWPLDEASGDRADAHGGYTLTDVETVGSSVESFGTAADFDVANAERLEYSGATTSLDYSGVGVAFWAWVSLNSFVSDRRIFCLGSSPTGGEFEVRTLGTTQNQVRIFVKFGGTYRVATCATLLSIGTWYFVAAYYDPTEAITHISVNNANAAELDVSSYGDADSPADPGLVSIGGKGNAFSTVDAKIALAGAVIGTDGVAAFKDALPWLAGGFRTYPEIATYTGG